jgi:eukaryotic-like serine/threonine-protein kinase
MAFTPNDIILNKYRIEALIGRGAFAEVYRATHVDLNVPRALKVLRQGTPGVGSTKYGDFQARFQLEAQLGARLDHPNIIRVHDFEQDDGILTLVMEYAQGGGLAERLAQARERDELIPIEEVVQIGIDVASGLAELHERDIVHRDLKPSNILFDRQGRAKVADLGLAQVPGGPSMRSQLSAPNPHPGTPGYMSPEQEDSGKYLRPSSDVYALGLILFELLTGRNYYNVKPGTKLVDLRKDIPNWLEAILLRMLDSDPKRRPWDGDEVARLLKEGPPKRWYIPRWLMAAVAVLIVVGVGLGLLIRGGDRPTPEPSLSPVARIEITIIPPPTLTQTQLPTQTPDPTEAEPSDTPLLVWTATGTKTSRPSSTVTKIQMPTNTPVPTSTRESPTLTPGSGTTSRSSIDGMQMVYIQPAGGNAFWIDQQWVTNAMFGDFIDATGYQTDAETDGVGYVWTNMGEAEAEWTPNQTYVKKEWQLVAHATWMQPEGPGSSATSGDPAVQVSWNDAAAYCDWAGRSLPTQAQWQAAFDAQAIDRGDTQFGRYFISEWLLDQVDARHKMIVWEDILVGIPPAFSSSGWSNNRSADILTFRCKTDNP